MKTVKNNRLSFSILILAVMAYASDQMPSVVYAADDAASNESHADDGHDDGHEADGHETDSHGDEGHGEASGHGDDGHGGGHGHDESNLVHANASPNLKNILGFEPDLAVFSFIVFALLVLTLWKFAFGPIIKGLNAREENIQKQIQTAQEAAGKAETMLAEYESKLDGVATE